MVSWDTRRLSSSGYWIFSHPEICSGDQSKISLLATTFCNLPWMARRHGLGRKAESQASESASLARYCGRPPWRATSRLTVDAARSRCLAISRIDEPEAIPREISSRSASVSTSSDRRRAAGTIPPCCSTRNRMDECPLPNARPISCNDCPAFQRDHSSVLCVAESPARLTWVIDTTFGEKIHIRWCCIDLLRPPRLSGMWTTSSGSSLDRCAGLFLPSLDVHAFHDEP